MDHVDDLTIRYEEDGEVVVDELDKAILQGLLGDRALQVPAVG